MSTFTSTASGTTFNEWANMVTIHCAGCHVPFAITQEHQASLRSSKQDFYCPSGHPNIYRKGTEDILREKIAAKEREIETQRTQKLRAQQEAELASKREELAAGETRRLMKRITSGICPCCSRFFKNVSRHMETQHPGTVAEHKPFAMSDYERRTMAAHPTWTGARQVRRRFVKAHAALSDHDIAQLMIDGRLYASKHVPTVARAVANLRKSL